MDSFRKVVNELITKRVILFAVAQKILNLQNMLVQCPVSLYPKFDEMQK